MATFDRTPLEKRDVRVDYARLVGAEVRDGRFQPGGLGWIA
ncbi:MAG: hypothetical protein R3F61_14280 [Myxococcota bacterium]